MHSSRHTIRVLVRVDQDGKRTPIPCLCTRLCDGSFNLKLWLYKRKRKKLPLFFFPRKRENSKQKANLEMIIFYSPLISHVRWISIRTHSLPTQISFNTKLALFPQINIIFIFFWCSMEDKNIVVILHISRS